MTHKTLSLALLLAIGGVYAMPAHAQQATTPPTTQSADDAIPEDSADEDAEDAATAAPLPLRDPTAANPAPADASLLPVFKQFGETPGLVALMDDFMVLLLADKRTRPFFENADQAAVKKHLVDQFCVILGGPCTYTGRDMKSSHANLGIDRTAFNALVEDLQIAMNGRKIPFRAQNQLLAKLAPMHREIETR